MESASRPAPPAPGHVHTRLPCGAQVSEESGRRLLPAAWGLVLSARSGEDDVHFGVLGAGAGDAPCPVHLQTGPDTTVGDYLSAVREKVHSPAGTGGAGAEPVPQTVVDCRAAGHGAPPPPGDALVRLETGARPALCLEHVPEAVTPQEARRLLDRLDRALGALAAAPPDARLGALTTMPPEEFALVVHEWNDTAADTGPERCLHDLFTEQAARTPHAVAVVQGTDRLDYATLDALSDRVARRLAACGVVSGDVVAVSLRRTVYAVVALLGVLKSGAAYAPVDPGLPPERVRGLCESLRAPVVLTDRQAVPEVLARCTGLPALRAVLWVGPEDGRDAGPPAEHGRLSVGPATAGTPDGSPAPDRAHPQDPAYVIFTSGSTGVPKGVLTAHAPAVNLIRWVNSTYDMGPQDRVLCVASLSFDLSVYDVFGLLAAGGSIRIAAEDEVRNPRRLLEILDSEPITFWDSAPAALQQLQPFLDQRTPPRRHTLRLVFLSGDWIPLSLPAAVGFAFADPTFVALGGATEAAVWSNSFPVGKVDPEWSSIPYGRPITNARYHVLDSAMRPAPVGAPGDLCIGGDCLATAYHGAPRLTAGKFLPDPFGGRPGGRLYRTGDRARFREDGVLEFLGRRDQQVKIRGFRVELGEIEACLVDEDEVASAAAVVHGESADARIVAYAVPRPGARLDPEALRSALAARLPDYMVPGHVLVLDELPVTVNGKLDRAALPVPGQGPGARPDYTAPGTAVEKLLAGIWTELLDVEDPGTKDNFFDLGGHSLLLTQLAARLESDLQIEVDLLDLLENQTLAEGAAVIEAQLLRQDGDGHD